MEIAKIFKFRKLIGGKSFTVCFQVFEDDTAIEWTDTTGDADISGSSWDAVVAKYAWRCANYLLRVFPGAEYV